MRRRAGGGRARRVARKDASQFVVRAGCPDDKPRNPTANLPGKARKAPIPGGALSLGYFSLGKQRKVTRPPAGGRNARRVGGQAAAAQKRTDHTPRDNPAQSHWMTRFARPFGAALRAFCALRACPAFAGMTAKERTGEARAHLSGAREKQQKPPQDFLRLATLSPNNDNCNASNSGKSRSSFSISSRNACTSSNFRYTEAKRTYAT